MEEEDNTVKEEGVQPWIEGGGESDNEDGVYEEGEASVVGDSNFDGKEDKGSEMISALKGGGKKRGRPRSTSDIGTYHVDKKERVPSRPVTPPPPLEIPMPDGTTKGQFLHDLYTFMNKIGQPIVKKPHLGYQELDLYKLYQIVTGRGGMDEVTARQEWKAVYQELGIPTMSTSASYNTRTNYKKHLYLYELEHCTFDDLRPVGKSPKYLIGEYIRIVSENYDGQVFYARVVKIRFKNGKNTYYIHYNGWSTSHDEWMPQEVLGKLLEGEKGEPENLVNPQPNRSSKSNHIIGDPDPYVSHLPLPKPTRPVRVKLEVIYGKSDDEEGGDLYKKYITTSSNKDGPHSVPSGRRLRLKGGRHTEKVKSGVSETLFERIQQEMEKLEEDRLLEPEDNGEAARFLTADNLHTYNLDTMVGKFKPALLTKVDLRVPNLEDLVGPLPIDLEETLRKRSLRPSPSMISRKENISALKKELKYIRSEYQKKKRLLDVYSADSTSSSNSSNSGNNNEDTTNNVTIRKTRRGAPRTATK